MHGHRAQNTKDFTDRRQSKTLRKNLEKLNDDKNYKHPNTKELQKPKTAQKSCYRTTKRIGQHNQTHNMTTKERDTKQPLRDKTNSKRHKTTPKRYKTTS